MGWSGRAHAASVTSVPDGATLLAECERLGFEGFVSRRRDLPLRSGRRSDWVKVRCDRWRTENRERGKLLEKA